MNSQKRDAFVSLYINCEPLFTRLNNCHSCTSMVARRVNSMAESTNAMRELQQ